MKYCYLILLICLLGCAVPHTNNTPTIVTTQDIDLVKQAFASATRDTLVLVDIDSTIIEIKANMFRAHSKDVSFIDHLKKNRASVKDFEHVLSTFRLGRKVLLLSPEWPNLINDLKARQVPIYALTQMDHGPLGKIANMAEWRRQELAAFGIHFTPLYEGHTEATLLANPANALASSIFYHGYFMNGSSFSKRETSKIILATLRPSKVIFVDDREEHIRNVGEACAEANIPYVGIIFRATELLPGDPDPAMIAHQKKRLVEDKVWLEDEQAAAEIALQ